MEKKIEEIESELLQITSQFLSEQDSERAVRALTTQVSLERQLGIDSLGKVELFHRIEKHLGVRLQDSVMAEADTLQSIAAALLRDQEFKSFSNKKSVQKLAPVISQNIDLSRAETLLDVLIEYATLQPERTHLYMQDENGNEEILTYGELFDKASCIANSLIANGIKPDDTVSIMLPTSIAFFQTFFGILLAGAIPVPIYPPFRKDRIEEYALREAKILNNAEARALITFKEAEILSRILKSYVPSLILVTTTDKLLLSDNKFTTILRTGEQSALLQYTSGSTGDPKGILLNHRNILSNLRATGEAIRVNPAETVVSWLPLYHDMGLFSWINSLYFGLQITILSPISFLNRPERWLWAIHYHHAAITAAPNFAYELCVKKIEDEAIQGLDLSSLRLAFNGAEAVNPKTLNRFFNRFKSYGFKKSALVPVYGLAENTVGLAVPTLDQEPRVDRIESLAFETQLQAVPTTQEKNYREFVSEGKAIPDHEIRIVNDTNEVLPERQVGNIQFRGPSAMCGYYRNHEATQRVYHDGWWETGDLGYIAEGDLFLTGRKKDVIIKAGRNLYPEVLEEIVGNISGIRKGCVIAFGVSDPKIGTEKIIIVAETKLQQKEEKEKLITTIVAQVDIGIGVPPDQIILVSPNKIPKTSSGKLQRSTCKRAYLNGELTKKSTTAQWQMMKLFGSAIFKTGIRAIKKIARFFYTVYVVFLVAVSILPTWFLVLMLPRELSAKVIKSWARLMFFLSGCPIHVSNRQYLQAEKPVIFTANHASYVDAFLLVTLLPSDTVIIAKKELLKMPIISSTLKKLKYITVDRFEFVKNIQDTQRIQKELEAGRSILIFPEGTFTYASGVRPFKAGAFQLSVDTQIPICPMAIKNTRQLLREGSFLFNPTSIEVYVSRPVKPLGKDWQAVSQMRQEVRKITANYSGEALVDLMVAGPKKM